MRIYIYPNLTKDHYIASTAAIVEHLMKIDGIECIFAKEDSLKLFGRECCCDKSVKDAQLIASIGGDGTLLLAGKLALKENLPIVGINAGRKGSLCKFSLADIAQTVNNPFDMNHIQKRDVLVMTVDGKEYPVINDFVLNSHNAGRSIEATVTSNAYNLVYHASGVIIATPTGSAAYNIAAGGSVVNPAVHAIVITPICAFGDEKCSYVIPADEEITIINNRDHDPIDIYGDGEFICRLTEPLKISRYQKDLQLLF